MNRKLYDNCLDIIYEYDKYDKDFIGCMRLHSENEILRFILNWFEKTSYIDIDYILGDKKITLDFIQTELINYLNECFCECKDYKFTDYDERGNGTQNLLTKVIEHIMNNFDYSMLVEMCGYNQKIDYNCGNLNFLKRFNIRYFYFVYCKQNNIKCEDRIYDFSLVFKYDSMENDDVEIYLMRILKEEYKNWVRNKFDKEIEYLIKNFSKYEILNKEIKILKELL
jgi:hypothetical protein